MVFGKCYKKAQIQVQIEGVTLERVYVNTFFGEIIADKISWKPHIKHLLNKLCRSISVLAKTRHIYFTYCSDVWGIKYKSPLQPTECPTETSH